MKQYIGIDYSTRKISVARLYGGEKGVYSKNIPAKLYPSRMSAMIEIHFLMAEYVSGVHRADAPILAAIESPILGIARDVQTALWMAMTAGGLVLAVSDYGHEPMLVPPATWKKLVCGHGGIGKDGVSFWMHDQRADLAKQCSSQDEIDAMCLALYAEAIDKERGDDHQVRDGQEQDEKAASGR